MGTGDLPIPRARLAFEGSHDVGGNPAAVEATRLGFDAFAVDEAPLHGTGVEGDIIFDSAKQRCRIGVCPGTLQQFRAVYDDVVIRRSALPLAPTGLRRCPQILHADVSGWEIIDRRMARFQDPKGTARVGQGHAGDNDLDVPGSRLKAGGTGKVPYRFLTTSRLHTFWVHNCCSWHLRQVPFSTR